MRAGEMAQQVKVLADKAQKPEFNPRTQRKTERINYKLT